MVHDSHGIGKFVRMEERTIGKGADASRREYLVLEYAPSKRGGLAISCTCLWISSTCFRGMSAVRSPRFPRWVGQTGKTPSARRGAVRQIAGELVQLYATRQAAPGYAFGADTPWQREMEEAFPTRRLRISSMRSRQSRRIWKSRCRWIA